MYDINQVGVVILVVVALVTLAVAFFCRKRRNEKKRQMLETYFERELLRGRCKKTEKKLTNVSLYVCMSAGNSEMFVFLSVFFPTMCIFQVF